MDQTRFNAVTRTVTSIPSRRDVLRGLVSAGLGVGALRLSDAVEAKKKHDRKRKNKRKKQPKPVLNQYGCLDVGQACRGNNSLCCSGVCAGAKPKKGKRDNRVCAAHGAGTCFQDGPGLCAVPKPELVFCNDAACYCARTTAGSQFCASLEPPTNCAACQRDSDCEALGYPPGSACAPFSAGLCAGSNCPTGMACLAPCGTVSPAP